MVENQIVHDHFAQIDSKLDNILQFPQNNNDSVFQETSILQQEIRKNSKRLSSQISDYKDIIINEINNSIDILYNGIESEILNFKEEISQKAQQVSNKNHKDIEDTFCRKDKQLLEEFSDLKAQNLLLQEGIQQLTIEKQQFFHQISDLTSQNSLLQQKIHQIKNEQKYADNQISNFEMQSKKIQKELLISQSIGLSHIQINFNLHKAIISHLRN
jgi:hypothetical protein